jgi:D-inositol-3-phosphate glycosyltransferase
MSKILECDRSYRLFIAGEPKSDRAYWDKISQLITRSGIQDRVVTRIEHVSDEETEVFFKAADIAILPYTDVFQSGVLFLAYAFGLPVIAADVGGLKDEVIEGRTGYIFKPRDSADLAKKIELYFKSELFLNLNTTRADIREYANEKYSWNKVSRITTSVYTTLLPNVKGRDAGSGKLTE